MVSTTIWKVAHRDDAFCARATHVCDVPSAANGSTTSAEPSITISDRLILTSLGDCNCRPIMQCFNRNVDKKTDEPRFYATEVNCPV